jgi:hypothetical protein
MQQKPNVPHISDGTFVLIVIGVVIGGALLLHYLLGMPINSATVAGALVSIAAIGSIGTMLRHMPKGDDSDSWFD